MDAPLRIGLAGLGTVGGAFARMLERHGNDLAVRAGRAVQITAITARSRSKPRAVDLSRYRWVDDAVALARDPETDVYLELIGGADGAALASVKAAIAARKHVVTANKALLAAHGVAL